MYFQLFIFVSIIHTYIILSALGKYIHIKEQLFQGPIGKTAISIHKYFHTKAHTVLFSKSVNLYLNLSNFVPKTPKI